MTDRPPKIFLLILLLVVLGPFLLGFKSYHDQFMAAKASYLSLKRSRFKQSIPKEWDKVIAKFRALLDEKPPAPIAEVAAFTLGQVYYDKARNLKDAQGLRGAIHYFHQVTKLFPYGSLADNAQFLTGDIYFLELKDFVRARWAYKYILEHYPRSDVAESARLRLREIRKLLSPRAESQAYLFRGRDRSGGQGSRLREAVVHGVKHWSNRAYTRVVVDLSGPVSYTKRRIGNPDRIYVDLKPARLNPKLKKKVLVVNDGLLRRVRFAQNKPGVVRVVVDIEHLNDFKVFMRTNPYRLTIDVHGDRSTPVAPLRSVPIWGEKFLSRRPLPIRTVVLDPGHGGKDPGAVGPRGLTEKEVNLDIAKRLKRALEARGVRVILTRDRDVFVSLEERTAIANINNADIFISIHANASPHRGARGIETYFLNATDDEQILRVASKENGIPLSQMTVLEKILFDLDATDNATRSIPLANAIQAALVKSLRNRYRRVNNLGAKPGPFYVLVGAKMPAVLVETSFISNPREEARLRSRAYRQRIANAILWGIQSYARQHRVALRARP